MHREIDRPSGNAKAFLEPTLRSGKGQVGAYPGPSLDLHDSFQSFVKVMDRSLPFREMWRRAGNLESAETFPCGVDWEEQDWGMGPLM